MGIHASGGQHPHWNYFIALEQDLERASRYVEFAEPNFPTYSLEFAHLMFAAASEVEVVLKRFCARFAPKEPTEDINDLKKIVLGGDQGDDYRLKGLPKRIVSVPRFGLELQPWKNWSGKKNPDWWKAYNAVKHNRHERFTDANLHNALNAVGALFVLSLELACRPESPDDGGLQTPYVMLARHIDPKPRLFTIPL